VPHHRGVRATAERRIVLLISAVDAGESTWPPRAGVTDLSESGHPPGPPASRSLPLAWKGAATQRRFAWPRYAFMRGRILRVIDIDEGPSETLGRLDM